MKTITEKVKQCMFAFTKTPSVYSTRMAQTVKSKALVTKNNSIWDNWPSGMV